MIPTPIDVPRKKVKAANVCGRRNRVGATEEEYFFAIYYLRNSFLHKPMTA